MLVSVPAIRHLLMHEIKANQGGKWARALPYDTEYRSSIFSRRNQQRIESSS